MIHEGCAKLTVENKKGLHDSVKSFQHISGRFMAIAR